ncbi:ankyrin repeat-containing domain protein [Xylaria acuta]|nr:ankyrin repeat-containing domain protein [Xylaria acuta]
MPLALCLPLELLYYISKCLDDAADLSSWSRSCRAFHAALTPLLYHHVKDDPMVMCWACDEGRLDTVQRLLDAGADPNVSWVQDEPRWWTLRDLHNAHCPPAQLPSEESRRPSPQLEELPSRVRFRLDVSKWLRSHAAIDDEKFEYFEYFDEGFYDVDDDVDVAGDFGLVEAGPRSWSDRHHWNPYIAVKTFPQRCYWTPLHIAAAWGNDKLVNLLLENGANINALSRLFCTCATPPDRWVAPLWTPLHTSMCHGRESTTRLLLSRGASTNITTRYCGRDKEERRFTALHSACTVDLLDAARALVDGGYQTDVTVRDSQGLTPLAYAFFRGNWAMIDFLLEHGADIDAEIGPLDALGHACVLGYYAEALRLLDLGATSQGEYIGVRQRTYFHLTAVAGAPDFPSSRSSKQKEFRLELVNRLIKHGIDVKQRGIHGTAALTEAASFHRVDVVKALLHSGADVRASDGTFGGFGALYRAISLDSEESRTTSKGAMLNTVRALLEAMAETPAPRLIDIEAVELDANESDTTDDVDICDAFRTICSLRHKHEDKVEVVALLLRYSRSVEMANVEPNLVYASILRTNFDISNLLLESGFNRPCEMQFDNLIRQFIENDIAEGLCHILNRFPDIAPRIRSGQLLCDAVHAGSEECAQLLINEGVPINSRNEDGNSLLFTACAMGDTHTAELLLKNGADPDECAQAGDLLTTVDALDENRDIIRLLLDYGASIHSSPPGKPTRQRNVGLLDVAIGCGLIDAVEEILDHKSFGSPTDEEISRHWQTVIGAPSWMRHQALMLDTLLASKRFDKDQIFTIGDDESSSMITTPLHMCAAASVLVNKTKLIKVLINHGADIHKRLPVRPNTKAYVPKPESKPKRAVGFEGTTALGWAIEFSSIRVVRALFELEIFAYGEFLSPEMEKTKTTRMDLMLLYAKAACRRQKPKMFSLLFNSGLDPTICDEDGNTLVHMICDYVETFWHNAEPEWAMECIAGRSVFSLIACLNWGVMYQLDNKQGVSGMDRVLGILKYSGNCEFHQTLAKHWCEYIDCVEGSSPRLTAKFAAMDDYDEEEPDDEESDSDDSDDESSDGELDLGDEMWDDDEPYLNDGTPTLSI